MNRRLAIVPLLALPLLVLLAVSCGGQSQTSDQQPTQLSPEEQARQTVTDFLEMCKQGQVQEAFDRYVDEVSRNSQFPGSGFKQTMSKFFDNVTDYSVGKGTVNRGIGPSILWVTVDYTVSSNGDTYKHDMQFECNQDGTQITLSGMMGASDSLDAQIVKMLNGDRVPGEVVVTVKDVVSEEEAFKAFASHGFDRPSVEKQYAPQMYVLHFSENSRDIKAVIKELMLDGNFQNVSPATVVYAS